MTKCRPIDCLRPQRQLSDPPAAQDAQFARNIPLTQATLLFERERAGGRFPQQGGPRHQGDPPSGPYLLRGTLNWAFVDRGNSRSG